MSNVALKVNGAVFTAWTQADVSIGLEQLSGGFNVSIVSKYPDVDDSPPIAPFQTCQLLLNNEVVITGKIEKRDVNDSKDSGHVFSISGRDASGQLVDCSAPLTQWRNQTVGQIALQLASPYGVPVTISQDSAPIPSVVSEAGQSIAALLQKLCQDHGLLLVANGIGGLTLTRTPILKTGVRLKEGETILSGSASLDVTQLFSSITVLGQDAANHNNKAVVLDSTVPFNRPLIVKATGQASIGYCQAQAEWERATRHGKASSVSLDVVGWRTGGLDAGELWKLGMLVWVDYPTLLVNEQLVVSDIKFSFSGSAGTKTSLELKRLDAFKLEPPEPLPQPKGKRRNAKGKHHSKQHEPKPTNPSS
jgi:prophage tail gpP-like protein